MFIENYFILDKTVWLRLIYDHSEVGPIQQKSLCKWFASTMPVRSKTTSTLKSYGRLDRITERCVEIAPGYTTEQQKNVFHQSAKHVKQFRRLVFILEFSAFLTQSSSKCVSHALTETQVSVQLLQCKTNEDKVQGAPVSNGSTHAQWHQTRQSSVQIIDRILRNIAAT